MVISSELIFPLLISHSNSELITIHRVVLKWHMHSMHLLDASRGRVWRAEAELEAASQRVCKGSPWANKLSSVSRIQDSPGPTRVNKPSLQLNPVSHLFLYNWWANNFTFFKWVEKNQRKSNISRHVKTEIHMCLYIKFYCTMLLLLLLPSHTAICLYIVLFCATRAQDWVVVTETCGL